MPREESNNNEETTSTLKKFTNNLYYLFCGDDSLDKVVNQSITFNTYMQIVEVIHIIILYTWFNGTNNQTYDAIGAVFSGLIIATCFITRLSNKHYALLLAFISFLLLTIGALGIIAILIQNYFTFTHYCWLLESYSSQNPSFNFKAQDICSRVMTLYRLNFTIEALSTAMRIFYLYLNFKAYRVVKQKYNEEQKRRRRKQKFDQNMKNKNSYDPNRKI